MLKPIAEQVMVITGADSGIGLATAKLAAARGASLVLCSRNEAELARIAAELTRGGARVEWHAGDVADPNAMLELAEVAVRAFGRIDTWVNNAGLSIYGRIEDTPVDDARRMFDTNYWGVVNGSLAALPYLRGTGGALINVGSIVSDTFVPLQGHYSASKHAVKGFTDALRVELEHDGAPISVTLVKPGAIDTPFPDHAANYMDAEAQHPQPVYTPDVVARAIVHCAQHPRRSVTVGGGGRMMAMMGLKAPKVADAMSQSMFGQQKRKKPGTLPQENTLWEPPARTGRTRGDQPGPVLHHSTYTAASLHPVRTALALVAAAAGYALATGGGEVLVRRGREALDSFRGRDGADDPDVDVQVRTAPRYDTPDVTMEVVTEEVYVMDAAPGDRWVP
ncbi:SDR family oxidoreductase [Longimicrobium sp.]|uniref:SDR family oxidoreductase n=1 Tax=Longimicrobium sp. TaxID=2029185 RepID=UPI002B70ADDD|nr:SDR family oxidoreductase [Longimicrobium sp.]HSU16022.1 SDR family oxidoreductase [Longimicrobium sp.]